MLYLHGRSLIPDTNYVVACTSFSFIEMSLVSYKCIIFNKVWFYNTPETGRNFHSNQLLVLELFASGCLALHTV